ncbi:NRDE family protein [Bailinhaonella thermotolerans]|uniref:NRDE family protein n=1 Tax=Bailinhaonella thermotolerans TaxID=1070861 RepID=A0A3A4B2T7_9ACTN|nr:NRDE family protein [Bailinhaonella thermotolerans]RJL36035.1 hypothetical protein D5H75_04560 [Bailinhaonella thermotolerans]
MCTVVVSWAPGAPTLLLGVRDEVADRPWEGPGAHWPQWPGLLGGRDLLAGGTWLAVDPRLPRAAALLNGVGPLAPGSVRRSRGELPLRVAATGVLDGDLSVYDPFHLVLAEPSGLRMWHWDGVRLTRSAPPPGVHMIVNSGWERGTDNPRVAHFLPRFAAEPERKAWREIATGGDRPAPEDPRALIVRAELPDGRAWGSSSVSLLELGGDGLAYEFSDLSAWRPVEIDPEPFPT